jgi:addiction module HigA family antidote
VTAAGDWMRVRRWAGRVDAARPDRLPLLRQHPGVMLQSILDRLGVSQNALAHATELSQTTIKKICDGHRGITPPVALRIAHFLSLLPPDRLPPGYTPQSAAWWLSVQAKHKLKVAECAPDWLDARSRIKAFLPNADIQF